MFLFRLQALLQLVHIELINAIYEQSPDVFVKFDKF